MTKQLCICVWLSKQTEKKKLEKTNEENKDLLTAIKDSLGDKVVDVKVSSRLKSHPVCLVSSDGVSFEMEKVLNQMPDAQGVKAGRILEIENLQMWTKTIEASINNRKQEMEEILSGIEDMIE